MYVELDNSKSANQARRPNSDVTLIVRLADIGAQTFDLPGNSNGLDRAIS